MKIQTYLSFIILLFSIEIHNLSAQCTPPMGETCEEANVICSLDQLNGYSCSNTSTIASPCSPLCSQGGVGNNTSWWGFVTQGGGVTITLNVGTCSLGQGLEFGVWSNCVCGEEIICRSVPCITPFSSSTASANLLPCRTYYLWVDGCNGDVCDFTINTSGGAAPTLSPIGNINNKANMIIGPVCEGACNVLFFVNPQPGGCEPTYVWTLNGDEVGGNDNEVRLDLPDAGDFVICVTAYIGNPQSGSICSQQGPKCATIKVERVDDVVGLPRVLCYEQTTGLGFKWHSKRIKQSGVYREQFTETNCCGFDSVVEFIVLETPQPEQVYFITCDNAPFIDLFNKRYYPCLLNYRIPLPKSSQQYQCDSIISLTAINVDYAASWSSECIGGMVELIPNIRVLRACNAGETYQFDYLWYKKNKPNEILGTDERLRVDAINEDYCLQVTVTTELNKLSEVCTRTFCESLSEDVSIPGCPFTVSGNRVFCFDSTANYKIDSFAPQNVNYYNWIVDKGTIISKPDSEVVSVRWSLNKGDTGKICVSYNANCGTSCQKCKLVVLDTKIAGDDFEKRGLSAYLDAKAHPNGIWKLISGPYQVRIEDPTNPRTKITAFNYGYYCFEWSITGANCTMRDTLCVNLHSFKKASPEYPKNFFDERAELHFGDAQTSSIVFTPNLIDNKGESYILLNQSEAGQMKYHWFDIYGRSILNEKFSISSGIQRMNINSPVNNGMYILLVEVNEIIFIQKVCVVN